MDINNTIRQMVREELQSALSKAQVQIKLGGESTTVAPTVSAKPAKKPGPAKARAPRSADGSVKDKILGFLKGLAPGETASAAEIGKGIGGNPNTVNVAINRLWKSGDVARPDRGQFTLPAHGQNGVSQPSAE